MKSELRKIINDLGYELNDEREEEGKYKIHEFTKEHYGYLIYIYSSIPMDGIEDSSGDMILLKIFEGHIGNDPVLIEKDGSFYPDVGVECIIADSDQEDFIENLADWDKEALQKIDYFNKVTSNERNNGNRSFGVSGFDSIGSEEEKQEPFISGDKVGRNDPCPCGSGKKYKKCHGR